MKQPILLFIAGLLLIVSCAPVTPVSATATFTPFFTSKLASTLSPLQTPTITLTPFLTFTPSLTSTLQPQLVKHEWYPDNVLVYFSAEPGIGIIFPLAPDLILYADGRMFITNEIELNDGYGTFREQIVFKRLSLKDVCKILNTLEQTGYLDYNPESYYSEPRARSVDDAGSNIIHVNAWKTNKGKYYALGVHLYFEERKSEEGWGPWISPALRNTYRLLADFPSADFEIYNPEEMLVWVSTLPDFHDKGRSKQWPLQSPTLSELHKKTGSAVNLPGNDYAILEGRDAQVVFEHFGKSYDWQGDLVLENDIAYVVFARPFLPYEKPQLYVSQFPATDAPKPDFKLTCRPSDGLLPIPTPSNP